MGATFIKDEKAHQFYGQLITLAGTEIVGGTDLKYR